MSGWFRVPEWCALADDPAEAMAALWLLGRWHLGRTPSVAEFKRHTGWGWDRSSSFAVRLWGWAGTSGAARPDEAPGKSGSQRGGHPDKPGRVEPVPVRIVEPERGETGEAPGSNRGASCGRDPSLGERENKRETSPPAAAAAAVKPPRAPKPEKPSKRDPHPAHARFGPMWDEARRSARMAAYPWPKGGAEAGRTWKAVAECLDAHVSRDPEKAESDLVELRTAMDRFHRKPAPAFPAGHTVPGFCANATTYLDATHGTGPPTQAAPTNGRRPSDLEVIGPGLQRFLDRHKQPSTG